jgi:hypothetical protein
MSNEQKIRNAIRLIWRNLPEGDGSTFGPCSRGCDSKRGARGSGPCLSCAQKDLAKACGSDDLAHEYVMAVGQIRMLEKEMIEHAKSHERA